MSKIIKIKDCKDCPYTWSPDVIKRSFMQVTGESIPFGCKYSDHIHYTSDKIWEDVESADDIFNHFMSECSLPVVDGFRIAKVASCAKCPYFKVVMRRHNLLNCKLLDSIMLPCPLEDEEGE